jgi:hypothetical protein
MQTDSCMQRRRVHPAQLHAYVVSSHAVPPTCMHEDAAGARALHRKLDAFWRPLLLM